MKSSRIYISLVIIITIIVSLSLILQGDIFRGLREKIIEKSGTKDKIIKKQQSTSGGTSSSGSGSQTSDTNCYTGTYYIDFTIISNGVTNNCHYGAYALGSYNTTNSNTTVGAGLYCSTNYPVIGISFPSNNIGTWHETNGGVLVYYDANGNQYNPLNCTINVTNYGSIGGPISGTFYGKVVYVKSVFPLIAYTNSITNGIFNVKRTNDNL